MGWETPGLPSRFSDSPSQEGTCGRAGETGRVPPPHPSVSSAKWRVGGGDPTAGWASQGQEGYRCLGPSGSSVSVVLQSPLRTWPPPHLHEEK